MHRILLVEDDPSFGYILKEYLELNEFVVIWVKQGELALRQLSQQQFDLCLLDIMLPQKDGFALAKEIKDAEPELPFIFLTAKALKIDKLKGFRIGCDDYIVKPIDEELLIARMQAIINRSVRNQDLSSQAVNFSLGEFHFDAFNQQLIFQEEKQFLTDRESELLKLLCEHKNRLLPRKLALRRIWGNNDQFNRKSMDVFIHRLRRYLEKDPQIRIRNIHGKGFILEA